MGLQERGGCESQASSEDHHRVFDGFLGEVGRLSVLECAFWGFLLLSALLHLFPLLGLFVTFCNT